MYQTPPSASISRSIGARVCSTVRASDSSSPSAASDLKSASGRPTSLGMMWNSDVVAGVNSRILSLVSRNSVATSVL